MSLALTAEQISQLQSTLNSEDYANAYELMAAWTGDSADSDVQLVHTWLLGAADINRGDGPFAALVKAYNQRQGLLRGMTVSDADNQAASDFIASNIISTAIAAGAIPNFTDFVEFDAQGGASLYQNNWGQSKITATKKKWHD